MSVHEKMTAIADAIREKTGDTQKLGLDAMAAGVGEVYEAGKAEKAAEYDARIYTTVMRGGGDSGFSVYLPFCPDVVYICALSSAKYSNPMYVALKKDFRLFSYSSGYYMMVTTANSTPKYGNNSANSTAITYADNMLTYTPTNISPYNTLLWDPECDYILFALKYTDKSDKELLYDMIASLGSDVGKVTLSQKRVLETVSEEEWEELIAPAREAGFTFELS